MTDSTGSILLDDMNFGTSKIVPQLSQSGDVVLVKHLFLETLSNLTWFKVYCLITYMFPRKKSQRFSSLANTSYPRTPTGQSLPAKNQSFWGLVMWRYKVFQRDFAMSGVSQEEMDSCVLIIWIDLYEYIYILYICLVLFVYRIIYISIHTTTYIYICIFKFIHRDKVLAWSFYVCRLHHRLEEERSSCHRSCGYLG